MSLSIGIVGLPNVGKSTLFNALLKRQVALAANYPFATIEPNVGVVDVPDHRLDALSRIVKSEYQNKAGDRVVPEKIVSAVVKFIDIAGLVKGASQGEGLGNQFLSHIREVDAIAFVVRDFNDENVLRSGSIEPKEDFSVVFTELILSDIQVLSRRLERGKSVDAGERGIVEKLLAMLNENSKPTYDAFSEKEQDIIKTFNLLSLKPGLVILNVSEENISKSSTQIPGFDSICISAKLESELSQLNEEERKEYLMSIGLEYLGLDTVIKKGYELLNLQTFFTAGPKEVRAWTIKKGTKAPQAAGVIHTDFERGFISANVVSFKDLNESSSLKKAKESGLHRLEGKSYTMQDGDVVEFNFSV